MRRKLATKLITVGMAAMLMAGCGAEKTASTSAPSQDAKTETEAGGSGEETPAEADRGETVNLKIHTLLPEQPDSKAVMDALNEYTKEKLNITVEYVFHGGSYADKIQVIIASGEEYNRKFQTF